MIAGILFCLMTLIAVGFLCWPLLKPRQLTASRLDYDLQIYRAQLRETVHNLKQNLITEAQAASLRAEIHRRILTAEAAEPHTPATSSSNRTTFLCALALILLTPLAAATLYAHLGTPSLAQPTPTPNAKISAILSAPPEQRQAMIRAMVERLAEKMAQHPDDSAGWLRLAHAYRRLGDFDKARDAAAHALKLKPDDLKTLLTNAEIQLAAAPDAKLPNDFIATMRKILTLNPDNPDALYYTGEAERQSGHPAAARKIWQKLLTSLPPDSPERAAVSKQIEALGK